MNDEAPEGLGVRALRTRVYYDPESGQVVHVHRLVSPEDLDDARIEEELAAFEESLEQRHAVPLESVDVDDAELQQLTASNAAFRVDVAARRLVPGAKDE